jgi:hypothetical protein
MLTGFVGAAVLAAAAWGSTPKDRKCRSDRLAFLLVDVLVDHLIGDRPGGDRKVAACPEVPTPELALEVRKLLEEKARAGALEPLHDLADVLVRAVAEEQVHVALSAAEGHEP